MECVESTPFYGEVKMVGFILKTVRVTQQTGGQTCPEIGHGKNFAQTGNQQKLVA